MPVQIAIAALMELIAAWWVRSRIAQMIAGYVSGEVALAFFDSAKEAAVSEFKAMLWKQKWVLVNKALTKIIGVELQLDDEGNPTQESITKVVSDNLHLDIELRDIFDREKLKEDLEKLVLIRINENLGFSKDMPLITSLRDQDKIRSDVHGFIGKQAEIIIDGGASPFLAADAAQRFAAAALVKEGYYTDYIPQEKQPLLQDKKSVQNRARQAKFRAKNKRHWEER